MLSFYLESFILLQPFSVFILLLNMTEEVGKTAGAGEGSKGTAGVPLPKKTYPPDIILDKDGKP